MLGIKDGLNLDRCVDVGRGLLSSKIPEPRGLALGVDYSCYPTAMPTIQEGGPNPRAQRPDGSARLLR